MKYVKVLLPALAAGLLVFAGCSGKEAKTDAAASGTVSFTAVGYGDPWGGDWSEFPILKEIADQNKVSVKWTTVSGDGADEKLGLILSSKDLPDMIFSGLSTIKISKYAALFGLWKI